VIWSYRLVLMGSASKQVVPKGPAVVFEHPVGPLIRAQRLRYVRAVSAASTANV
jgi:hypothetical protein